MSQHVPPWLKGLVVCAAGPGPAASCARSTPAAGHGRVAAEHARLPERTAAAAGACQQDPIRQGRLWPAGGLRRGTNFPR